MNNVNHGNLGKKEEIIRSNFSFNFVYTIFNLIIL